MCQQHRLDRFIEIEHQPHEKPAGLGVTELIGFHDIAVMVGQRIGNSGDDAHPIRAGDGQNVANHSSVKSLSKVGNRWKS